MEGTMGEIRMFAADFVPKNWMACNGQILALNSNQALFSLLGVTYGGDGVRNFALPDLRSRIPLGTGSYGGMNITQAALNGAESHTLLQTEIPTHLHVGKLNGSFNLMANSALGDRSQPDTGLSLAAPSSASGRAKTPTLGFNTQTPNVSLNSGSLDLSGLNINMQPAGGSQPHSNMQPYIGINYIICTSGVFPSRS